MNRNVKDKRRISQRLLIALGYTLPISYQQEKRNVCVWHYTILFVAIVYAGLSVVDIWQSGLASCMGFLLRLLSALTIIATLLYKKSAAQSAINRAKNRKRINLHQLKKVGTLNEKVYTRPLYVESFITLLTGIFTVLLFIYNIPFLVIMYKLVVCGQVAISCFISCVNNCAEFYQAKPVSYI